MREYYLKQDKTNFNILIEEFTLFIQEIKFMIIKRSFATALI